MAKDVKLALEEKLSNTASHEELTAEPAPDATEPPQAEFVIVIIKTEDGKLSIDTSHKEGTNREAHPVDVIQVAAMMDASARANVIVGNINKSLESVGDQLARLIMGKMKMGAGGPEA